MDAVLCDELLQDIFGRLSPPSSAAVALVSRRWRRLLRSCTTSLSVHFPTQCDPTTISFFSSFLSHHPFLSSLSLTTTSSDTDGGDHLLLLSVASSCPNLRRLRYLCNPVSTSSLFAISTSCAHLSSISITLSRPLSFHWLRFFSSLECLSLIFTNSLTEFDSYGVEEMNGDFDVELSLESLSLSGVVAGDYGLSFLWRNCKKVKKLQLKSCESLGDHASFSSFMKFVKDLQEVELRTCRSIVDGVLLKLAENCISLDSLLVYDGGSKEGLLQFINQSKCNFRRLDLRLPLDLDNTHLIALASDLNFRGLVSLSLQSCCLVTGEGLKALARAVDNMLEELALINCDVVERESGLLTSLGQNLKRLRKLDLSHNEMLFDKELTSMLASCHYLIELKLRGCERLTNVAITSMIRSCKQLQNVDITYCRGIEVEGVEILLLNSPRLRQVEVEERKLSDAARTWASNRFIKILKRILPKSLSAKKIQLPFHWITALQVLHHTL